jgi:penicillin-binding protein 1C
MRVSVADRIIHRCHRVGRAAGRRVHVRRPGASETLERHLRELEGRNVEDGAARALTFGLASPLATRYRSSVKTGISKDMRDNWAVGYTSRYTVGVWVGNFSGESMHDVSGVSGAAPIWRDVMDFLHDESAPAPVAPPADAVRRHVTYANAVEPERNEWFVAGTEAFRITPLAAPAERARLATPVNGAIYAIDPDIPRQRQGIAVTARGALTGARFVFEDGRRARADAPYLWLPAPGARQVTLVDRNRRELDRVRIEVRGVRGTQRVTVAFTAAAP